MQSNNGEVPEWVYAIIKSFILKIDLRKLEEMVKDDTNLLKFTLSHPNNQQVFFWLRFFTPFVRLEDVSEKKILILLLKSRPDVVAVLNKRPGWLHRQFVDIVDHLKYAKW